MVTYFKFIFILNDIYVCVSVRASVCVGKCLPEEVKRVLNPGTGVTGSDEPPALGAGQDSTRAVPNCGR